MNFEVLYFVDEKGNAPVQEYMKRLPTNEKSKVYAYLKHLSDVGYKMRRPFADSLGAKTGLYELRPGRHRILYFFFIRNKVILLRALMKKTDAIPERDIEIALQRKEICEVFHKYHKVDFNE